jgi:CxxC-x17-CxxC domain-containing protein
VTNALALPNPHQGVSLMMLTDRILLCRDCGRQFAFTAGEQEFYRSRGLTNDPGRCPDCRAARKASRDGAHAYSSSSEGFSARYGGPRGYERSERPRRELFPAVCSACGRGTRVPFQPRGDKPVYCSDCFERVRAERGR